MSQTKIPWHQYPTYHVMATRVLHQLHPDMEFNPDFVNPDLLAFLKETESLVSYFGTSFSQVVLAVQAWRLARSGSIDYDPQFAWH